MTFALSSGATVQFSPTTGEWQVVSVTGVVASAADKPLAALLLLEEEPSPSLLKQLEGFPFDRVVDAARASQSPRYMWHADQWAAALQPRTPKQKRRQ